MPHCIATGIVDGGTGKMLSIANGFPRLADKYMERTTFESQKTDVPIGDRPNNLYEPVEHAGGERGSNWTGRTKSTSLYTSAALHPRLALVVAAGAGLLLASGVRLLGGDRRGGAAIDDAGAPDVQS